MDIWQIVDLISQVGIFIFGLGAVFMLSCLKNKWGNVIGLAHQPFWYFTTLYHHQWTLFVMSIVYTGVWLLGIYKWFYKSRTIMGG
ncbi:MAG: hypothetical protein Q7K65_03710 [Candidatus Buchananbacteria bacterium]|nr:hypothetical protein [Candidatus Buchananbacteria bacterium]